MDEVFNNQHLLSKIMFYLDCKQTGNKCLCKTQEEKRCSRRPTKNHMLCKQHQKIFITKIIHPLEKYSETIYNFHMLYHTATWNLYHHSKW